MIHSTVIKMLSRELALAGSYRNLAELWNIPPSTLHAAMNGDRNLTPAILEHMGLIKITRYKKKPTP